MIQQLRIKQAYSLELKIELTKRAIQDFVSEYGENGIYVAFSGGKDSTVLLDIVRKMYPNTPAVFANTGNEFPEIVQFVRSVDNVTWVKPRKSFAKILKEEGYPIISKKTSRMLRDLKNPTPNNAKSRKLYMSDYTLDKEGNLTTIKNNSFKIAYKHRYLIDAPFSISEKCCNYLKKYPMLDYQKSSNRKPIIGTQANESKMRESAYLKHGCNNFKKGASTPLGFWTEQDVLEYIVKFELEIASIYGEIKQDEEEKYYTTGESRTGCVSCGFGAHMEGNEDNRYLRLEQTHPKLHNHVINNLGFGEVLDYMNIRYSKNKNISEKVKLGNEKVEQYKFDI